MSDSSKPALSMADLMAKHQSNLVTFKKGDLIKGTITKLTSQEILVDINAKTEATVLEKDRRILKSLLTQLHVGDEVTVSILNPESDTGNPVVSLRKFIDDRSWDMFEAMMKDKKQIEVTVTEITKGGLVVMTEYGVGGFLPHSHMTYGQGQQMSVGQVIKVSILELNRKENKIILSQKASVSDEEFSKATKSFKSGEKVTATVVNTTSFGIFVTVPVKDTNEGEIVALDGLIHISEISWEKTEDTAGLFSVGQDIEAVIIGFDKEAKRLELSIKRLTADPFEEIVKRYAVDKRFTLTVEKLMGGSVYLALEEGVEGLIKKEKIPPTVSYKVGESLNVTVSEVDVRRRRILFAPVLMEKPLGYR